MIYLTLKTLNEISKEESVFKEQQRIKREHLVDTIKDIGDFGLENDWSDDLAFRVTLVVEEMVQNILDYGYQDSLGDVKVVVISRANTVSIDISDDAPPFDPLNDAPAPDLTSVIEERHIGGLGIYLTRTLMDSITYSYESGKNHLHMIAPKVREGKEKVREGKKKE